MIRFMLALLLTLAAAGLAVAQNVAPSQATASPPAPAPIAPAGNPYSVVVPVAGTNDDQRNAAIASALVQVLQQASPGFTADADTLAHASSYVRDFRYRRAGSGTGLQLQVDFDPGAVGRLVAAGQNAVATAGPAAPAVGGSAAAAAQSGSGTLWVGGLTDSRAFAGALAALRGDAQLHDVIPMSAQGDGVLLSLKFDQSLAAVMARLTANGGHLTVAQQAHPGADVSLHWTP